MIEHGRSRRLRHVNQTLNSLTESAPPKFPHTYRRHGTEPPTSESHTLVPGEPDTNALPKDLTLSSETCMRI